MITFNNVEYFTMVDMLNIKPDFFPRCSKTWMPTIRSNNLTENDYVFMKYNETKNMWTSTNETDIYAEIFITKSWVNDNLAKNKTENDLKQEEMYALIDEHERLANITSEHIFSSKIRSRGVVASWKSK